MKRVLVVDDEKLVRQGIITTFPWEKYGFAVAGEAGSGERALAFLEREKVDLIVTDLAMNGMSGLELIREVRQREGDLPVAILTCHDSFSYIQEAMRLGVVDYIVKTEIEDEVVEETLRRIADKLERVAARRAPVARAAAGGQQAPDAAMLKRWTASAWIYEEETFERLLAETKEKAAGTAELKRALYQAALEWDRLLGTGTLQSLLNGLDSFRFWDEWEAWIRELRASVLRRISENGSRQVTECILRAVEILKSETEENPHLNVGEADVAARVGMSRGYFSKCFKKVTGRPYGEYVKELKLERAKKLLLQTDETITRVAEMCGFTDYRHFSRVFRDYAGMLPNEYRKSSGVPGAGGDL